MRCRLLLSQRKILRISRGDSRMNSTRVLVTMALLTLGLSIFALARVALPPQAVLEETISGTIAATRTITQRFRGDGIMLFNSTRSLVTHVTASTNCQSGIL